jgi:hypothetical protein
MALEVEVGAGNESASAYAQPGLWAFVDSLEPERKPRLLRGDTQWGTERAMAEAERRGIAYLFKLRQTSGVKRLIERLFRGGDWEELGEGWEGAEAELQLKNWSRARRVAVLRRRVRGSLARERVDPAAPKQLSLGLAEVVGPGEVYEYAVLVSSLAEDLEALGRLYRDRADAENNFDELKNQWGWAGFTTQDLKRCAALARVQALVYNWWGLFVRLVHEDKRPEAITSRPLLLHGIARRTRHGRQTTLTITSLHAKARAMSQALERASAFLARVRATAEQLSRGERWRLILSWIFRQFLHGRPLGAPEWIAAPTG